MTAAEAKPLIDSDDARPSKAGRAQILALSGGGYRGLFTARILEQIEVEFKCRVRDRFNLISGTSAGALIAAAIAHGIEAKLIRQAFENHGSKIFPTVRFKAIKQFFVAPYNQEGLSAVLDDLFGKNASILDQPLSTLPVPLLVTAVSVQEHRARVFGGRGLGDNLGYAISLREAILSSAAAPTYFPLREPKGAERLVDGGMVANAPDLVALVYARRHFALDTDQLFMLSIGTAAASPASIDDGSKRKGILRSVLSKRGLVQLTLNSQEELATRLVTDLLGVRYFRIDQQPSPKEALNIQDLDRCDGKATSTLLALANRAMGPLKVDSRFRAYF